MLRSERPSDPFPSRCDEDLVVYPGVAVKCEEVGGFAGGRR